MQKEHSSVAPGMRKFFLFLQGQTPVVRWWSEWVLITWCLKLICACYHLTNRTPAQSDQAIRLLASKQTDLHKLSQPSGRRPFLFVARYPRASYRRTQATQAAARRRTAHDGIASLFFYWPVPLFLSFSLFFSHLLATAHSFFFSFAHSFVLSFFFHSLFCSFLILLDLFKYIFYFSKCIILKSSGETREN